MWTKGRVFAWSVFIACLVTMASGPRVVTQGSGPVAAYDFGEGSGTTTLDWSGNNHTADLIDGPAWTTNGRFGSALTFDGINDGVRLPVSSLLDLDGALTVSAWVRPTVTSASRRIVQTSGPGSDGLALESGRLYFRGVWAADAVPIATWTHVAATYDGSSVSLYQNGVLVLTEAVGAVSVIGQSWIGRTRIGDKPLAGEIDEVRIYRRALSAAELMLDLHTPIDPATPFQVSSGTPAMNGFGVITTPIAATMSAAVDAATVTSTTVRLVNGAGNAVSATVSYDAATRRILLTPTASLAELETYTITVAGGANGVKDTAGRTIASDTAWSFQTAATSAIPSAAYAFTEGAGVTTADASGNGHTATLINGPTWTTSGYFGNALTFDGTDDGVQIPLSDAVSLTTAFTLEAWIRPTATSGKFLLQLSGPHGSYGLYLRDDGTPRFRQPWASVTGPTPISANVWTHLAVTYDGASLRLFVQGVQVDAVAVTGSLTYGQSMWIGRSRGSNLMSFSGAIDDVRIYRRALSTEEIATDMATPADQPPGPPPTLLSIAIAPVGASIATGATYQYYATGTYDNGTTDDVTMDATWTTSDDDVATINGGLATGTGQGLATVTATIGAISDSSDIQVADDEALPNLPSWVATPLSPTRSTPLAESTAFLYTGSNPIQTGVTAGTIIPERAAVVRGAVKDRNGALLPGVVVSVIDRPEFGSSRTRLDGEFDLAVNAGGSLVVRYTKPDYLPVDRRITVPAGDFAVADDVVMVPLDPLVTTVDLTAAIPIQVAQGSVETDDSGSRRSTLLFSQGTTAAMTFANGSTQPISTLHVRATEYTVGDAGEAAMPGALPPASAYTYAVELSVDEAIGAGATSVQFSSPVAQYVENFIGLPVGAGVPAGFYNRQTQAWEPIDDGVVLKIVSIDGSGRAALDLTGDDVADGGAVLSDVGITDAERTAVASLYAVNQTLWRVRLAHFTPVDLNMVFTRPDGVNHPLRLAGVETDDTRSLSTCDKPGSIIECQDQVLGERLPVSGTPFSLNYRSDRVPGGMTNHVTIPLTEATLSASVQRIDITVEIAGRRFTEQYSQPTVGLVNDFTWDGLDVYGRRVEGATAGRRFVQHFYPLQYRPQEFDRLVRTFGLPLVTTAMTQQPVSRRLGSSSSGALIRLGPPPRASASGAGWSIDVHHVYQPKSGTVLFGDGRRRVAELQVDGPPVEGVDLPVGIYADAVVAETGIYYVDGNHNILKKVPGQAPEVIGTLPSGRRITADRHTGDIYYADCAGSGSTQTISVYRFVEGGTHTVRGTAPFAPGHTCSDSLTDIARAPDGTVYVGMGTTLYQQLVGGPLRRVGIFPNFQEGLAVGASGDVYRSASTSLGGWVIERFEPTGRMTRVAGSGVEGYSGDGGNALNADLGYIYDLAVADDGSVVLVDFAPDPNFSFRLRRVDTAGIITTIGGGLLRDDALRLEDGTPATALSYVERVDVGPDGWVYLFGHDSYRLKLNQATRIASEDGSEFYEFNVSGQHLRTVNALTGAARYTFTYNTAGYLTAITDGDGLVTQIHRTPQGAPISIQAPFGQTTTLATDANGWLSSLTSPGNRTTTLTSTATGLLTQMVDANGNPFNFTYNTNGRLIRDDGPAGGSETLSRLSLANGGWTTTNTTEMGRVTTYQTEILPDHAQRLTITQPDGTTATTTAHEDGRRTSVAADGTTTALIVSGDPRFGLHAPVPTSMTATTPGGKTLTAQTERWAWFDTPGDYSTLHHEETVTVNGRQYATVFEPSTRTFTTTTPAGRTTTSTIDAKGRITSTQVGNLTAVEFAYDAQGRLTSTEQDARTSAITYDSAGRASVLTDALSRTVSFGYDTADRVTTQTLPDTRTIGFGYDPNSNVTSLTPPSRPAHTFTYTPIDFTSSYVPPTVSGTGPTGYLFNVDRQPTEVQRPEGQTTTFSYGATNGRLNSVTFSRGTLAYGYDTAGRVSTLADPGGVNLAFTYDGPLPLSETWSGPVAGVVSRTFSNDFNLATESVNGAHTIAFGYDDDRLLTAAGALTITRDATNGLVTGTTLGSTTETHQYNTFGEPSRQTSTFNTTQLFDVQTTRDNLGRITQRIETFPEITRTFHYGYDLAGRLETVTRDGVSGLVTVAAYTYDGNGNRLTAQGEAYGGGAPIAATYDNQDRLLTYGATSYTYTANGELASKTVGGQTTSYVYDTLGNLIQVTLPNNDVITYTIDGRGRRVGKSVNGTRVKGWLYADQLRPIAELDGSGTLVSRFVYGSRPNVPDYVIKDGTTYRVFSDHLGSPRVIVDAATGVIVQRIDFHAFGEVVQDSAPGWQPFGFSGGLCDPDTGLIRFGFRDYDPLTGRWMSKDPIGFDGADSNLFAYVRNDPIQHIDPQGTFVFAANLAAGAVGAIGGGVGGYFATGTWQGALTGAVTGGLAAAVNPFTGVAKVLFEGAAASALSQVASNFFNCADLFKIDGKMVAASALGGLAGNVLGKYLAKIDRSAFTHDLFRNGYREAAWLTSLVTGFLEGTGSALFENIHAGDVARAQRYATASR